MRNLELLIVCLIMLANLKEKVTYLSRVVLLLIMLKSCSDLSLEETSRTYCFNINRGWHHQFWNHLARADWIKCNIHYILIMAMKNMMNKFHKIAKLLLFLWLGVLHMKKQRRQLSLGKRFRLNKNRSLRVN